MRWTWKTLYDLKLYTGHFYRHRNRCQICLMFWVCQSITLASPQESYKEPCQLCIQGCLARHFMALSLSPSLRDSSSASITLTPADTPWRHLTQADISLHHHQTDHNPPIIKTFSSQNSYSLISQAVCPAGWFIMTPPDNICAKSLQLSKSDEGLKCENILQTLSPLFKMTIKQNLHDIVKYCSRASSIAYNNYTQLSTFFDDLFMFNSILASDCSNGWWKVQICAINIASFYNYIYKIHYYVSCLNILKFNV